MVAPPRQRLGLGAVRRGIPVSGYKKNPVHLMPRVMESLQQGNFMSQQIADQLGLPISWVSSALCQLADQGLVRRAGKLKPTGRGQRAYRWELP